MLGTGQTQLEVIEQSLLRLAEFGYAQSFFITVLSSVVGNPQSSQGWIYLSDHPRTMPKILLLHSGFSTG